MNTASIGAIVFTVAAAGAIAFQLAMVLGAPWGAYTLGGRFPGRFRPTLRVVALAQAVVLGLLVCVVLARADLALPSWRDAARSLAWVAVAFSALSLLANAASRSVGERRIWVPVTTVMVAGSLVVAIA